MNAHILTASDLRSGNVVFLTELGDWSPFISEARLATGADEINALRAQGKQALREHLVVDPFVIEVATGGAGPVPVRFRELLRVRGPSIRPELSKPASREAA